MQQSFSQFFKIFPQIQEGGPNFLGVTNSAERLNYFVPLLCFNFKNLKDLNSASFIRFQHFLRDAALLFSVFQTFLKFNRGHLISLGEPILENGWIIFSPLLYLMFKNLKGPNS